MESHLALIIGIEKVYGQVRSGTWDEGATAWISTYKNLTNIII